MPTDPEISMPDLTVTPSAAAATPAAAIRIQVAVWGPWGVRLRPALALLRFAAGLLLPVHLRWTEGRLVLFRVGGGSLRARGGTAL
jgi:hypothetical protein